MVLAVVSETLCIRKSKDDDDEVEEKLQLAGLGLSPFGGLSTDVFLSSRLILTTDVCFAVGCIDRVADSDIVDLSVFSASIVISWASCGGLL